MNGSRDIYSTHRQTETSGLIRSNAAAESSSISLSRVFSCVLTHCLKQHLSSHGTRVVIQCDGKPYHPGGCSFLLFWKGQRCKHGPRCGAARISPRCPHVSMSAGVETESAGASCCPPLRRTCFLLSHGSQLQHTLPRVTEYTTRQWHKVGHIRSRHTNTHTYILSLY